MIRIAEAMTEAIARELLSIRGCNLAHPPKGNVLWKNEYRDYPHILEALEGRGKGLRGGDAYPDFLLVKQDTLHPLIVGETKSGERNVGRAIREACDPYGEALADKGINVLAIGIAGDENTNIAVSVKKRARREWKPIEYNSRPIQWIPTIEETELLLGDDRLFDLEPKVPSPEILSRRGNELNRIFRECSISDSLRPAAIGAFMLALWQSKGKIRTEPDYVLNDINAACQEAFVKAGKLDLAKSILVNAANDKLAAKAAQICYILRLLNVTTLTAAHDYLGQLYESFFRFTGGNTIGQYFTPRHVTRFMVDLCDVSPSDYVVDPTCGTGGFLISSLYRMLGNRQLTHSQLSEMVKDHLRGFEDEPITAALCVANMILRGDGTTGIIKGDCFTDKAYPENEATVVLGNPPFPHAKTDAPPDKFVDRGLDSLQVRGRLAMIVPMKLLVLNTKESWREKTLKNNSLRAVITLPKELFEPYSTTTTAIIILEKGIPHNPKNQTFFCQIENDGYRLRKNVRVEQEGEQLTDGLTAFIVPESVPGFCIWDNLIAGEWAPGAYIEGIKPREGELENIISCSFRSLLSFVTISADKLHSFQAKISDNIYRPVPYRELVGGKVTSYDRRSDRIGSLFDIYYGQDELESKRGLPSGVMPIISSSGLNNGCCGFYDFSARASLIAPPLLTVPRTGSIGDTFVQLFACGVTSDCLILLPKAGTDLDDIFIAGAVIRREKWRFNYGRKMTPQRIASIKVPRSPALKSFVLTQYRKAWSLIQDAIQVMGDETVDKQFYKLATEWKTDTKYLSTVRDMAMHSAYQRIIGMGKVAIPFIMDELTKEPNHWFWALNALT